LRTERPFAHFCFKEVPSRFQRTPRIVWKAGSFASRDRYVHCVAPRVAERLRRWLASPYSGRVIAALAALLALPTLAGGLAVDDLYQRLIAERRLSVPGGRLDIFGFVQVDPVYAAHCREIGLYPWWTQPTTQVMYWRPFAAITHFVDYTWWPRAAWLMHLENVAWYCALVMASGAFYRRFAGAGWVAGLATALYAFDHAHATPVAWIANRNALMAAFFGVMALLAHDRWRREGRRSLLLGASLAFVLALLSSEAGVAIAGYLVAYALFVERGAAGGRALSLLPCGLVTVAWRVVYRALGHGVAGTGLSVDPLSQPPLAFLHRAAESVPILTASSVSGVPIELWLERCPVDAVVVIATALLLAASVATVGLLRKRGSSRFFAAGVVLSALIAAGALPSDRYAFWIGLGIFGLVAQLFGESLDPESPARATWVPTAACAFFVLRGVLSPLAFLARESFPGIVEDQLEWAANTVPEGPDLAHRTVVILNTPHDIYGLFLPIVRLAHGQTLAARQYVLYAGVADLTVSAVDARTLEVASLLGWAPRITGQTFRTAPFHVGDTAELTQMRATVRAVTDDGRARVVRFSFTKTLSDPSLEFLAWGADGLEPFAIPAAGAVAKVPAAPLFMPGPLRPHLRLRATEGDVASAVP
jgi:hypothetical protein